ncbi:MAG: lyase family protein [Candidatus Pacebacteria bacterium]|nr:lyase family protein [Candidatus Paceibacterota bacterium]
MIKRYEQEDVRNRCSKETKVKGWDKTELAVIEAREHLGRISHECFDTIRDVLKAHPVDIAKWEALEKEMNHDLNAYSEERKGYLPAMYKNEFHRQITSYDTEESEFVKMLDDLVKIVMSEARNFLKLLKELAIKYRYTLMNGRTHGQEAELQSFGKKLLTWYREVEICLQALRRVRRNLKFSKISGAMGNYTTVDPELEREALKILGLKPLVGVTQIMPRVLYAPVAQALCNLVQVLDKIALDFRLGARSGRPLWHEPFGKKNTGSSILAHKKNSIRTEQMRGMMRLAKAACNAISEGIETWEERAIEQSCVERVGWPDLFHITLHCLRTMTKVLSGIRVYPDNMLLEIVEIKGCYATPQAGDFLKQKGPRYGLTGEEPYRVVQLAAFNLFEPNKVRKMLRERLPRSLKEAGRHLTIVEHDLFPRELSESLEFHIPSAMLRVSDELAATPADVRRWNAALKRIFASRRNCRQWERLFSPVYLLRNEGYIFKEVLGV